MTAVDDFLASSATDLRDDLIDMIETAARLDPRSQQKAIGPSEIGHPCMRRLASFMIDIPECNPGFDVLPSVVGKAMHKHLESVALDWNEREGWERFTVETRVEVWPGLAGSMDLYDNKTQTVIDWKVLGKASFDKYRRTEFPEMYRNQIQMYGKGAANAGRTPQWVAIAAIPKAGLLRGQSGMTLTRWPYDPSVTDKVHRRWTETAMLLDDLDAEKHPERVALIARTPENCQFCPWYSASPDDSGFQCIGG